MLISDSVLFSISGNVKITQPKSGFSRVVEIHFEISQQDYFLNAKI